MLNSINDENEEIEPTDEELETLEHVSDRIPSAVWLIVICEFCERFAFIGLTGPFQNYIQFPIPHGNNTQPGALDRGHETATIVLMCFQFMCYFTPVFGAIIADQFWGKYKTIFVGCMIYICGLLILVGSSIPYSISSGVGFPGLITAMTIFAIATGFLKSNVAPMMAQQYTKTRPIVKEINGKKKIIDPTITLQSMFIWFYWSINLASFSSIITTNVEKYHSFWLAYLIPMVVFTGSIFALIFGYKRCMHVPPTGSLILRAFRVTMIAIRCRLKHGKQVNRPHLLDYAKETLTIADDNTDDEQFIDELKRAYHACIIFAFYPFFWLSTVQLNNNLVYQAAQMYDGVLPNDVLQNLDAIVSLLLIPIFDKIIYPTLRRFNVALKPISRITLGFLFSSMAMGWSAFIQYRIYSTGPNFSYIIKPCSTCQQYNNISLAWQVPSYIFMGISEIFGSITGLEYAFTQAPSSMKSIVISLFLFTTGIGSALNLALLPMMIDPKILWLYVSMSGLSLVAGLIFFLLFHNEK